MNSKSTVYLSNRAAAHSSNGQFDKAEQDAQAAIDIDPSFARAYSRLGHALYSQNKFSEAVKAYEAGLEREPGNAAMKSSLETARSRLSEDSTVERSGSPSAQGAGPAGGMPDLSALAGMFGGAGAPGGAGGMPDLASMMVSPSLPLLTPTLTSPEQPSHDANGATIHGKWRHGAYDEQSFDQEYG